MRLYILSFCVLISLTSSAQSVFDKNIITGDNLREMLTEIFESPEGQTIQQADVENGQDITLLINSSAYLTSERVDIRNALIDLQNNAYDLDLGFSVQVIEESNQNQISQSESQRAIRLGVNRVENKTTLYLSREVISEKRYYNLLTIFEKEEDDWELLNQNLTVNFFNFFSSFFQ